MLKINVTKEDGTQEEITCKSSGLVFEDPSYHKPVLNVPIKWISFRGNIKISTAVEDGEYVVSITTIDLKSNKIRVGFSEFAEMTAFVNAIECFSEVEQEIGGFIMNPKTYIYPCRESLIVKTTEFFKEKLKLVRMALGAYG